MVLDFLAVDNFNFTRKIVKKIWDEKLEKRWGFVKIEFLDKNLTFRIVCYHIKIVCLLSVVISGIRAKRLKVPKPNCFSNLLTQHDIGQSEDSHRCCCQKPAPNTITQKTTN